MKKEIFIESERVRACLIVRHARVRYIENYANSEHSSLPSAKC